LPSISLFLFLTDYFFLPLDETTARTSFSDTIRYSISSDLEFVAGVLRVKHFVADLELHRHLGAVVQNPSGPPPTAIDHALLGLLFGGCPEARFRSCLLFSSTGLSITPVA